MFPCKLSVGIDSTVAQKLAAAHGFSCPMVGTAVFGRHHRLLFRHKLHVAVAVHLLGKHTVSTRKLSLCRLKPHWVDDLSLNLLIILQA